MEEYEKYNYFRMDITLNKVGYDFDDMESLFEEPFYTSYHTKVGFEWYPSAVGHNLIDLQLIFNFILTGASTVIVSKVASDLYDWTKKTLSKVLTKKNDFNDSRIAFVFNDITIVISAHNKDDILKVVKNVDVIVEHLKTKIFDDKYTHIDFEDLNTLQFHKKD